MIPLDQTSHKDGDSPMAKTQNTGKGKNMAEVNAEKDKAAKKAAREKAAEAKSAIADLPIAESGATRIRLDDIEVDPMLNVSRFYIDKEQAERMRKDEFSSDEFERFKGTITGRTLINPVIVCSNAKGAKRRYLLRAGFRRYEACRQLEWETIPAKVIEADNRALDEINMIENIERKDISTFQRAASMVNHKRKYQVPDVELARIFGKNDRYIGNLIRCYEGLHPDILRAWSERNKEKDKAMYMATWTDQLNRYANVKDAKEQLREFHRQILLAQGKQPAEAEELLKQAGFTPPTTGKNGKEPRQTDPNKVVRPSKATLEAAILWFKQPMVRKGVGEEKCAAFVAALAFANGDNPNVRIARERFYDPHDSELGGKDPVDPEADKEAAETE